MTALWLRNGGGGKGDKGNEETEVQGERPKPGTHARLSARVQDLALLAPALELCLRHSPVNIREWLTHPCPKLPRGGGAVHSG